jgi:hypothetical protein
MAAVKFTQDQNEVLDYLVDWSQWLPAGDTIVSSTFTPQTGITTTNTSFTATTTTVWVSGGSSGQSYTIINDITTAAGRRGERTLTFQIKQL